MARVAFFVSPHGFGHAARACAVMAELLRQRPETDFHLFTEVPRWFFDESLGHDFTFHKTASDIGLAQDSPLVEDLDLTIDRLDHAPFRDRVVIDGLGARLKELGCLLVMASDVVVGKLGYSTVAEAYRSAAAFCYVARPRFPESPVLEQFVECHMLGAEIDVEALKRGAWLTQVDRLLDGARRPPKEPNGAEEAVNAILRRFAIP